MTTRFPTEVAEKLLDRLAADDDFRASFEQDPREALRALGYETPAQDLGVEGRDPVLPLLHLKGGLASKAKISAGRDKMLAAFKSSRTDGSATMLAFGPFSLCAD